MQRLPVVVCFMLMARNNGKSSQDGNLIESANRHSFLNKTIMQLRLLPLFMPEGYLDVQMISRTPHHTHTHTHTHTSIVTSTRTHPHTQTRHRNHQSGQGNAPSFRRSNGFGLLGKTRSQLCIGYRGNLHTLPSLREVHNIESFLTK